MIEHPEIQRIAARAAYRNPGKDVDVEPLRRVDPALLDALVSGQRVRVTNEHGEVRTGRVGITTGWVPSLLLMHRSNQDGSSDVLGAGDRVLAIQSGNRYYDLDADGPYGVNTPYGIELKRRRAAIEENV